MSEETAMTLPPDLEALTIQVTYATFYLIWAALLATWIFQIILRPSTRQEWAEFGKITAFLMIMTRSAWLIAVREYFLPQPFALFFWLLIAFLVGFYLYVIVDMWGRVIYEAICLWCKANRAQAVVGAVLVAAYIWVVWYAIFRLP